MRTSRPTPAQLEPLSTLERATFEIANFFARPALTPLSAYWNSAFMGALIYSCGGNRFNIQGLEHVLKYGKKDSVLLVANHRSFFDFYVISAMVYWRTRLPRRMFFPVRADFFYDHPVGTALNFVMSNMAMFPPVVRDPGRRAFNRYAVARCVAELSVPGTVLGLHPEGTRNKGDDPYSFMSAQPGVGQVVLGARRARVFPVFLYGLTNDIFAELVDNWTRPAAHPIDIGFGPEIPFDDLRARPLRLALHKAAADRCLDGIRALAERHRGAPPRSNRDVERSELDP